MRKIINHLFYETKIWRFLKSLFNTLYAYYYYRIVPFYRFHLIPDKIFIKKVFKQRMGYQLNLENPKTYNEKIQWLKLYDRTPLHTRVADKYAVRDYIKEKIGDQYLIPLVFHTDDFSDIIPENLPDFPIILKANHYSGGTIVIKDKSDVDWENVQNHFARLLKQNYYYRNKEWQYKNIKPRIVVEKLLLDDDFNIPNDYKLHMNKGKLIFTQIDVDRFNQAKRYFYDPNWNLIEDITRFEGEPEIEKPAILDKMIELSKNLSEEFIFARIDLYCIKSKIYFGEITFHPNSGFNFLHKKSDRLIGEEIILNIEKR